MWDHAAAKNLMDEVRALGVHLWREGEELCFSEPTKIGADLLARLEAHKIPVLMRLPPPWFPPGFRYTEAPPVSESVLALQELPPAPLAGPRWRPRALFASHDLSRSGAPLVLLHVLRRLRHLDAEVYSPLDGPLKAEFQEWGIPVRHRLQVQGYDLVVANTLLSAEVVKECQYEQVPCVWLIHEFHPEMCGNHQLVRQVIGYPRLVFFPHPATAQNYAPWRQRGIVINYNCLQPVPIRDRADCRQRLGFAADDFVIVTAGQDEPRKGQADLREAVKGLPVKAIYLTGQADPWSYYAAADLYVCCSRNESFGLSIQEAKQYGLPVITTDLPCCVDQIHDGVHGLHYTPGDHASLRAKIIRLLGDPALRRKLSAPCKHLPGFAEVVQKFENAFLQAAGAECEQPIHVVYHVAGMGNCWRNIVREQLGQLRQVGLTRILCTHVGEGLDWLIEEGNRHDLDLVIAQHEPDVGNCEVLAIRLIERLAARGDKPILYLHTKGASRSWKEEFYHEWRRLMMAELVVKWRAHVQELHRYDAVGVNWWYEPDKGHFSGNFFLVTPGWVRKLPRFDGYYRDRYSCERWLGSVPDCRVKSLLCHDKKFWADDMALMYALRQRQNAQPAAAA